MNLLGILIKPQRAGVHVEIPRGDLSGTSFHGQNAGLCSAQKLIVILFQVTL